MARTRKIKRGSCGFCMTPTALRHQHCPGTLPRAAAGKPWTCWCSENGHPTVIPEAPIVGEVKETDVGDLGDEPTGDTETRTPSSEGKEQGPKNEEPTEARRATSERCGHMTGKGPCKRRAGHTKGHDGR